MDEELKDNLSRVFYAMTKHCAIWSFDEFLEHNGITKEEFEQVEKYLHDTYGVELYV